MDRPNNSDLQQSDTRSDHTLVSDFQPGSKASDLFQQQRAELVQQTNNLVEAKTLPGIDLFDGSSSDSTTADSSDPSSDATPGATESQELKGPAIRVPEDTVSSTPLDVDGSGSTDESESNDGADTGTNQSPAAINDNKDQPQNGTSGQDDGSSAVSSAQDSLGYYASHGSTYQDEIELKTSAGPRPLDGIPPLFPRPGQQHPTDDSR